MKYWPVGSYLVMKSTPRVTGGRPLLDIGYGNYKWEATILSWCCRGKFGQENFNIGVQQQGGL